MQCIVPAEHFKKRKNRRGILHLDGPGHRGRQQGPQGVLPALPRPAAVGMDFVVELATREPQLGTNGIGLLANSAREPIGEQESI